MKRWAPSFSMAPLMLSLMALAAMSWAETIVFLDGTQMEVERYEIKNGLVLITTTEGKLRSVPLSYVDLAATERENARTESSASPASREQEIAPIPTEIVPPTPVPEPPRNPEPPETMSIEPEAPGSGEPQWTAPPPVWASEELDVSLVIPSSSWRFEDRAPSFDVAVSLEKPETEAKATLGLIRGRTRTYGEFMNAVDEIRQSVSTSAGYTLLTDAPIALDPYIAHELRFRKELDGTQIYNQLVVFYSRDLVYVLSLSCPEEYLDRNEADFAALTRGVVIERSKSDLTPKGLPQS